MIFVHISVNINKSHLNQKYALWISGHPCIPITRSSVKCRHLVMWSDVLSAIWSMQLLPVIEACGNDEAIRVVIISVIPLHYSPSVAKTSPCVSYRRQIHLSAKTLMGRKWQIDMTKGIHSQLWFCLVWQYTHRPFCLIVHKSQQDCWCKTSPFCVDITPVPFRMNSNKSLLTRYYTCTF